MVFFRKNNKSIVMTELEKKYITIKPLNFRKITSIFLYSILLVQALSYSFVSALAVERLSDEAKSSGKELTTLETSELTIVTPDGRHSFLVEVAQSPVQRQQGLMGRKKLRADRGMLFDFGSLQIIHMWMKNTYIPLDMVFLDQVGNISSIATNTTPFSINTISSSGPARAVLELYGGTTSRLKIKVGDKVFHQIFKR